MLDDKKAEKQNKDLEEIWKNPIKFKIIAAKFFLKNIPTIVPLEINLNHRFLAEINIESFLYFSISSVDMAYGKINELLSLGIKPWQVSLKTLSEELQKKNESISQKILLELEKYTSEPTHTELQITKEKASEFAEENLDGILGLEFWSMFENRNGTWYEHNWERSKSSLWELRKLRNIIAHTTILRQSGERGTIPTRDALSIPLTDNPTQVYHRKFVYNPKEYFSNSISNVEKHITDLFQIVEIH